jgi:ABC-type Fe3+/spermidine/putrescine transport system ATPase subunit
LNISLAGISKSFGAVRAVGPLDLEVAQGEFVSLLGPSGCGKTTTLRIIAGFATPDAGTVRLGGQDVTRVPVERRGLSMVFQNFALFPHLDVFENVAFGLRLRRRPAAEIAARVKDCLALVGLAGFEKRLPREMSGGQQQRAALARALVIDPAVLLLDEPLSSLDLKLREQLRGDIRAIQRRLGITAVFVTHDQGEAMALSDRVAVMRAGRIEQYAPPREIYERPATAYVAGFIGHCNLLEGRAEPGRFVTRAGLVFRTEETSGAMLAIRPEALRIAAGAPVEGETRLRGTVRDVTYLGDQARLDVVLAAPGGAPAETLMVQARVGRGVVLPAIGAEVEVAVDAADCHLVAP